MKWRGRRQVSASGPESCKIKVKIIIVIIIIISAEIAGGKQIAIAVSSRRQVPDAFCAPPLSSCSCCSPTQIRLFRSLCLLFGQEKKQNELTTCQQSSSLSSSCFCLILNGHWLAHDNADALSADLLLLRPATRTYLLPGRPLLAPTLGCSRFRRRCSSSRSIS